MSQISTVGLQTLQAIANANHAVYLNQAEGQELLGANLITIDASQVSPQDPSRVLATITEAGLAVATGGQAPAVGGMPMGGQAAPAAAPNKATFKIDDGVAIPPTVRTSSGPRDSKYPFEQLNPGQSFHVPNNGPDGKPLLDNEGKPVDAFKTMSAAVAQANQRYKQDVASGEKETVTRKRQQKDAQGNVVKGPDGKPVVEKYEETRVKQESTRTFIVRKAAADDPAGPGARVFRKS